MRLVPDPVTPDDVVRHLAPGSDVIVPLANGEPVTLLDAIERHAADLDGVRVHQMHALHDRPYLAGAFGDRLRHVSYFLSHVTRPHFHAGTIDLVPNNFSEMRDLLRAATTDPLVRRHGVAARPARLLQPRPQRRLRRVVHRAGPFLPRGQPPRAAHVRAQPGARQPGGRLVGGGLSAGRDRPRADRARPTRRSPASSPSGCPTAPRLQTGIGAIPNAILSALGDHRDLGIHTELISDGVMDLVERGVVNGVAKQLNRTKTVGTFALGTRSLYDFLDENTAFELWPVRYVNDPRIIATEANFVSINATIAVDLLGQCASETINGAYYSSSGGQADFARGAMYSQGGQGFVVLHSTTGDGISKVVAQLAPGDVVTTLKNTVDKVVTEFGVAQLRGRSIRQRAAAMIAIAHPAHRELLTQDARRLGYL